MRGWLATAALAVAVAGCATRPPDAPGFVSAPAGDMQGVVEDGVAQYRGIPFAAPPVGPLRWRPPEAPARWSGTFQATSFGKTCAQEDRGLFTTPGTNEDCLYAAA